MVGEGETAFVWEATSEPVKSTLQFWLPGEPDSSVDESTAVIAYVFGGESENVISHIQSSTCFARVQIKNKIKK